MSQSVAPVNSKLVNSLVQIIVTLTHDERRLLAQRLDQLANLDAADQDKYQTLQSDIVIGLEQLKNGEFTEYDEASSPRLIEAIKLRGQTILRQRKLLKELFIHHVMQVSIVMAGIFNLQN